MKIAKLATPLIVSRLGDMTASFLFLAFVGHYLPDFVGQASFAWAFISFITVLGIGLFSTILIDAAVFGNTCVDKLARLFSAAIQLALTFGFVIVGLVFIYVIGVSGSIQQTPLGQKILLVMSLVVPALYCQIVVFNFLNAQGKARYELFYLWSINALFIAASLVCLYYRPQITIIEYVVAYVLLRWVGVVLVIFFVVRVDLRHYSLWRLGKNNWLGQAKLISSGAPLALCFGGESFLYFALSLISREVGDIELAAYQISIHFLSVIYMISIGVGNAAAILIAGDAQGDSVTISRSRLAEGIVFGSLLMAPCLVVCVFLPDYVALLYTSDQQVAAMVAGSIQLATPFLVFELIYVVTRMVLRSLGDSWLPTAMTLVCLNGIGLLLTWGLFIMYQPGVKSIILALTGCTFILMVSLILRYIRFTDTHRRGALAQ